MNRWFQSFAKKASDAVGSSFAFIGATIIVIGWIVTGPIFHYSDTWQLVMNTISSIITFLMVFLIQNAQNRDSEALQVKLDELIRAVSSANNNLIDAEDLTEEELIKKKEELIKTKSS